MAVVKAAMESGVATRPIEDLEAYRQTLNEFVNQAGLFIRDKFLSLSVIVMVENPPSYRAGRDLIVLTAGHG